jgi:hypothetical protein
LTPIFDPTIFDPNLQSSKDFPEKDQLLKAGHVFILKPACKQGFMRDSIRAGDTVAIEASGARRLGKRDLTFVAI